MSIFSIKFYFFAYYIMERNDLMIGVIMSIIAGSIMSIQGVFNTRLSEKTGLLESNVIVQGTAFLAALIIMWIFGKGDIKAAASVNKLYLLGGVLGTAITVTVMLGMKNLTPQHL